MDADSQPPFVVPADRPHVTGEPEPPGDKPTPLGEDVSWIGSAQMGGGHVPEDYEWTSNPKERQDEMMGE